MGKPFSAFSDTSKPTGHHSAAVTVITLTQTITLHPVEDDSSTRVIAQSSSPLISESFPSPSISINPGSTVLDTNITNIMANSSTSTSTTTTTNMGVGVGMEVKVKGTGMAQPQPQQQPAVAPAARPAPPPPPPPAPVFRDCGVVANDPGCTMMRDGKYPMDAETWRGFYQSLKSQANELTREEMAEKMLKRNYLTAAQYGLVLDLFVNELTRLEVAKNAGTRVVNPQHALGFSAKWKNGLTAEEYTEMIAEQQP